MTKKTDHQKIDRHTIQRGMMERFTYLHTNDMDNGWHADEYDLLESVLGTGARRRGILQAE